MRFHFKAVAIIFLLLLTSKLYADPDPVSTLTPLAGTFPNEIRLEWVYPGPDSLPEGSTFYIQKSTWPEIPWDAANADVLIATGPVASFAECSSVLTGLAGDLTYYFRVWSSSGTEGSYSGLSNGATFYMHADALVLLEKEYSAVTKKPGGEVTYRISFRNAGNTEATAVSLRDKLPDYLDYKPDTIVVDGVSHTDVDWAAASPRAALDNGVMTVIFDAGLPPGGTGYLEFKANIK